MTNPRYLDRAHPVRELLEAAASGGGEPSKAELDKRLIRDDLPDGADLNRLRSVIVTAARQVRKLGAAGDFQRARSLAADLSAEIAGAMTADERAVTRTIPEDKQEPLSDIAARMFGR